MKYIKLLELNIAKEAEISTNTSNRENNDLIIMARDLFQKAYNCKSYIVADKIY
jgi:hypothetical protein